MHGTRTMARVLAGMLLMAGAAARAQEPVLLISHVKVEMKTATVGKEKGNQYLTVSFVATPTVKIEPKMSVKIVGKYGTGADEKMEEMLALGQKWEELEVGAASKEISAPLFRKDGLAAKPEMLELHFTYGKLMDKERALLAKYCWNGTEVNAGACPE